LEHPKKIRIQEKVSKNFRKVKGHVFPFEEEDSFLKCGEPQTFLVLLGI